MLYGLVVIPIIIANVHLAVFPFYFILYLPYIGEYIVAIIGDSIIYRKSRVRKLKHKILKLEKKTEDSKKIEELKEELKVLEEKIDKIKVKRTKELKNPYKILITRNENIKWLIIVMVICLFTGLLTPLGFTPYTYLVKTMQGNTTQNISEHLPMIIANDNDALVMLVLLLALITFTKIKIKLCDLFMIGGLFYLMIASRRQITMFTLTGSIIFNRLIVDLFNRYSTNKKMLEDGVKNITGFLGISVTILAVLGMSCYMIKDKVDDKFVDESAYPVQACDYILENIDLENARFYNEYNYGSYMLFRGIPVFIDSRADLYAPEFSGKDEDIFMDFINVSGIGEYYEDIFDKYGITHVIMYKNAKINMLITKSEDSNYSKLYEDDSFIIYKRLNV